MIRRTEPEISYQPPLKPTLGRTVPFMPAQAGIDDFGRIDPQAVDGRNKPGHDGKRTPMGHSQAPVVSLQALRRTVQLVVLLNLAYFGIEFAAARATGSVSLFADSIDFLEDGSVNFLVIVAIGWTARSRGRVGIALAGILLVPAIATLWTAWGKLALPVAPDAALLALTGAGALAVNLVCAFMLARYRHHRGSLTTAAFLSARNDVLANIAIIAAGLATAHLWHSAWPDLIVGLGIAGLNARAAGEVWQAAQQERRAGA
jgi:Co/Zn/Cd efflux system component